ncbi:MAG: chromosome segregation protein SMC, partial [Planctomycetota bacterium]
GVDAYSLIEQGKVDRMLQASPRDRRIIFEEAAGISRFNAKKAEANRRLERVDQNLTRLKDIVDEVHTRLSRLKSQATKAQRYREMTARLQELRMRLGWTEYSELTEKCDRIEARIQQLHSEFTLKQVEQEEAREAARNAELTLHKVASECQEVEGRLQEAQQRIAVCQNQQESLWSMINEHDSEAKRQAIRLATLRNRAGSVQKEVDTVRGQLVLFEQNYSELKKQSEVSSHAAGEIRREISQGNQRREELRKRHVELLRQFTESEATAAEHRDLISQLTASIVSVEKSIAEQTTALESARKIADQAASRLAEAQAKRASAQREADTLRTDIESDHSKATQLGEQSANYAGQLTGAAERLEILEQLQQHLDGVDAGARHILDLATKSEDPVFASIHGLVAELLTVDVELAPLIDTALGASANILVLEDGQLVQRIRSGAMDIPGRLSLMRLDRIPSRRFGEKVQLDGLDGVIGRADRLVRCKHRFMPLITYLLGTTWIVDSLDVALELGHFRGAGLRFVTRGGEMIEADGLLTIGAIQSASGLISRQSEMQDAKDEISQLRSRQLAAQEEIGILNRRIGEQKPILQEKSETLQELTQEVSRQLALQQSSLSTKDSIAQGVAELNQQLEAKRTSFEDSKPKVEEIQTGMAKIQQEIRSVENELGTQDSALAEKSKQLEQVGKQETEAKVELARSEQKLESVRVTYEQSKRSQEERLLALEDAESELRRRERKRKSNELEILNLTSELSECHLVCEAEEGALDELAESAAYLRDQRQSTAKKLEQVNRTIDKIGQQKETSKLELERFRESTTTLVQRFEEDYNIDFEQVKTSEIIEDKQERQVLDAEAGQLRQDVASVGEINMAALQELDELQERYDYLNGQYEDLEAAKESLQRIIQKINQDSRRLFSETLEVIRQNFQKLYRKSFGGGSADIVLDEGEDVLECGIDIIATPPGKTALSNSLLSGGEKALTAVALLLAIFQHRPSPFCVLDEVDAPFDEANIGRFVSVLREFLDWTKFIIVTHSKKTMTASTTLYGVTMQESGVSKQVAVKFEDVNEKGEIIKDRKAA